MGWIELDVEPNDLYNAALDSFKQDEELQQYYLSRKVAPQDLSSKNFDFVSLLKASDFALLNYDAAMAIGIAACEAGRDFFSAADLFKTVARVDFNGASGHVKFNNMTGTRLVSQVHFTVQNLLSHPDPDNDEVIHLESIESAVVDLSLLNKAPVEIVAPFVYADNTTKQPLALPPLEVDLHLIPNWALGIGLGFCGIVMAMSIAWGIWTVFNRKQRTVRASQPFFLVMLSIGTFLMASSIIPTSFQEPMRIEALNAGCMLFPWLVCIGFVTAFSALFTKNGRINAVSSYSAVC